MWIVALLGDFSPLGWLPGGNLINEAAVAIGFIFSEDEKGNLYSNGRALGTIAAIGLETVLGLVGLGFLPFNTIRVAIAKAMS